MLVLVRFSHASVVSYGLALLIFAEHHHMTEVSAAVTAGLTDADPGGFPSSSRPARAFSHFLMPEAVVLRESRMHLTS